MCGFSTQSVRILLRLDRVDTSPTRSCHTRFCVTVHWSSAVLFPSLQLFGLWTVTLCSDKCSMPRVGLEECFHIIRIHAPLGFDGQHNLFTTPPTYASKRDRFSHIVSFAQRNLECIATGVKLKLADSLISVTGEPVISDTFTLTAIRHKRLRPKRHDFFSHTQCRYILCLRTQRRSVSARTVVSPSQPRGHWSSTRKPMEQLASGQSVRHAQTSSTQNKRASQQRLAVTDGSQMIQDLLR